MAVSVGAIGMVALGGLFIHAALTNQSPLADFRSLMTGKAAPIVSTAASIPSPQGTPLAGVPNEQQTIADLANKVAQGG